MERAAQVGHSLATDLATVASNDERSLDLAGAGLLNCAEVGFAAGHAGATHCADLAHPRLVEDQEHQLDQRVAGKLLHLAQERATACFAVSLDRGVSLGLEAREIAAEEPIGERDPASREAKADPLPIGEAPGVVGPDRRCDLRLRLLEISAEATASLSGLGNLAQGDLPTIAVERVEPERDCVGQISAGHVVERGPLGEAASEIPGGLLTTITVSIAISISIAVTVSITIALSRSPRLTGEPQARPRLRELAPRRTPV